MDIELLKKQLALHKSLNQLAITKTTILKKNDIMALQELIKTEQKHVAAITQLEKQRISEMGGATLHAFINELPSQTERDEWTALGNQLKDEIQQMKQTNEINQKLIEQSLQFVHITLDLYAPEPENYVYGRPEDEDKESNMSRRSMFDSKA